MIRGMGVTKRIKMKDVRGPLVKHASYVVYLISVPVVIPYVYILSILVESGYNLVSSEEI